MKKWIDDFTNNTKIKHDEVYRIIAVDDSYQDTGKVFVKLQVVGTSKIFNRAVSELYTKEWLEKLSKEDVAHVAALYTAEQTNHLELIKQFPKKTSSSKASVLIVGIIFTGFLILSNLTAFKIAKIAELEFPTGLIFFPLTYIFDDILTEVYGFKISRRVIWSALIANLIVVIGTSITVKLNPSPYWHHQQAYEVVYHAAPRVYLASVISYLSGEFVNSTILAKLKILTAGRYLWMRSLASTIVGVGIDSILFIHIAFFNVLPTNQIWKTILTMYLCKVIYETCAIPITYVVANYLKIVDNIDYYDYQTKFNPFSLKVD